MTNFIVKNEGFTCLNCERENHPQKSSCRNHCTKCLYSLHVDKNFPGDRESRCKSLMKPISVDQSGKKGWIIYHKCQKCGKIIPNKAAEDDNFNQIIELSKIPSQ